MKRVPVRVAVSGAGGRMGKKIIQEVLRSEQTELTSALCREGSYLCGIDVGELAGTQKLGVIISSNSKVSTQNFDVLIDFTDPVSSMTYLNFCCQNQKSMVIGTTGFTNKQKESISLASERTSIVIAPNFSVGVTLMIKLLKQVAKATVNQADIEIIDIHHNKKPDAPSGTALAMGEAIANSIGCTLSQCALYNRADNINKIQEKKIGFSSLRAGDVIGEHTVIFAQSGERLEITHKISNRAVFAKGAVQAAVWLRNKKAGLYDMEDIIRL